MEFLVSDILKFGSVLALVEHLTSSRVYPYILLEKSGTTMWSRAQQTPFYLSSEDFLDMKNLKKHVPIVTREPRFVTGQITLTDTDQASEWNSFPLQIQSGVRF